MIRRSVVVRSSAKADLDELRAWIAEREGARTADRYLTRVRGYLGQLADVAEVGQRLDRLAPGVRSTNFEGRRRILFIVRPRKVFILRIVDSARDLERVVAETDFRLD